MLTRLVEPKGQLFKRRLASRDVKVEIGSFYSLVPRVLSYPPYGARERERPGSLSRSVERVEENPGDGNTQFPVSGFTLSVYSYLENYDSRCCSSRLPCLFLFIRSLLFKQRNRLQRYVSLKYSSIFN